MARITTIKDQMPKEIQENLEPGEEPKKIVETFSIKNTPEVLVITDCRVLYLEKKLFRRYYFQAIPYMKMLSVKAKIGRIWGEFIVEGEDETVIHLEKVKKDGIISTFESMKEAINAIAVEPLSIIHKKGLIGEEWTLSKPPEMVMRQMKEDDPLQILKIRYARGEMTKEEYDQMKEILET